MQTIDFQKELNPSQYEACVYMGGPLLILAGAGSGKTRVLTHRLAYMISKENIPPEQILAITFTNKAAGEMKQRAKALIGDNTDSFEPTICTFHSLGYQILKKIWPLLGFKNRVHIADADDAKKRLKKLAKEKGLDKNAVSIVSNLMSAAKDHLLTPEECKNLTKDDDTSFFAFSITSPEYKMFCQIYEKYQDSLMLDNLVDFDDLIMLPARTFRDNPKVLETYQEKFKYIMVDEYQDTSHAQFELVRLLAEKYRNITVVGDDYQSIYAFRGADITNILSFQKQYPNAKVVILGENYRSTKTIVDAAASVISYNKHQFQKDLVSMNDLGEPIKTLGFYSDREEAEYIADMIDKKHKEGESLSSFAVLYRQNSISRILEQAMFARRLPVTIFGGLSFYQRAEIKDMISYMSVIGDTGDSTALLRIINTPARGIGKTTLDKFEKQASELRISTYDLIMNHPNKNKKIESFKEQVLAVRAQINKQTALEDVLRLIIQTFGYEDYLLGLDSPDDDEIVSDNKIENIGQLISQCHEYDEDMKDVSFEERLEKLLEDVALMTDQDMNTSEGTVSLMSMHRSKGLEYPYVFIAACEDEIFPGAESDGLDQMDEESKAYQSIIEEERRLCYVAMTRAKKQLYITYSKARYIYGELKRRSASRFIKEIIESQKGLTVK